MLRVTVEIVPNGVEERARVLDILYIGNVSALADLSDYVVYVNRDPRDPDVRTTNPDGTVLGHRRDLGWGPLVARAISASEAGVML